MPAAHAKYRLPRLSDDINHARQSFRLIAVPGMTLPAQNYVRRAQTAHAFERHAVERFREDLEARNQTPQHGAQLARARTLTIDRVVYEVNEQGYFKQ